MRPGKILADAGLAVNDRRFAAENAREEAQTAAMKETHRRQALERRISLMDIAEGRVKAISWDDLRERLLARLRSA